MDRMKLLPPVGSLLGQSETRIVELASARLQVQLTDSTGHGLNARADQPTKVCPLIAGEFLLAYTRIAIRKPGMVERF